MSKFGSQEFTDDFAKLMAQWNELMAKVATEYPFLSEDERYEVVKRTMNSKLGL